jgi:hypothetical protein
MKRWVGLLGTISSISFAQIANSPSFTQHLSFQRIPLPQYSGIFPTYGKHHVYGLYAENPVSGTDLIRSHAWASWSQNKSQHRIDAAYSGSPDFNESRLSTTHFIALNANWSLGSSLGFSRRTLHTKSLFESAIHSSYQTKSNSFQGSLNFENQQIHGALGWSQFHKNYTLGAYVIKEGLPYHAYAYTQVQIVPGYEAILLLGSGPRRLGVSILHSFKHVHFQIGGAWASPLNRFQAFLQIQYDGQIRGDGSGGGDDTSISKRTK